jgi:nucleotide-binding universal stress UspA family protein
MKNNRILVPLDLLRGSAGALEFVQDLAMEKPLCVTLLHVVSANIAPIRPAVYDELCAEAEAALRRLAGLFFGNDHATRVVVRTGKVPDEIIAEAAAGAADLIVLCGQKSPKRLSLFRGRTTRRVLSSAPCPTVILPKPEKVTPYVFRPQCVTPSRPDACAA